MSVPLFSLPVELTLKIVATLLLGTGRVLDLSYDDPRTLASDVELACTTLAYLANLSMTCRAMWKICSQFRQAVRFTGIRCHEKFLEALENDIASFDAGKTRFLSLESPANCEKCEHCSAYVQERFIGRLFCHFTAVTTLDLVNFRLTSNSVQILAQLTELQTLSVREPDDAELTLSVKRGQMWKLPRVANLSIVAGPLDDSPALTNLSLPDLVTLSIKNKGRPKRSHVDDMCPDGFVPNVYSQSRAPKLQCVSVGCSDCRPIHIRKMVNNYLPRDFITIDCTGIEGSFSLYYMIHLLSELMGGVVSSLQLDYYDHYLWERAIGSEDIQDLHFLDSAGAWRVRNIAEFSFSVRKSTYMDDTTIKDLEIIFASSNGCSEVTNEAMLFMEVYEMFREYPQIVATLETLSVAMSKDTEFTSRESEDDIMRILTDMREHFLPSIKKISVEWSQVSISI